MSLSVIQELSRERGEVAAAEGLEPYICWDEDFSAWQARLDAGELPRCPFPHLGDYVPDGWELLTDEDGREVSLFTDSTGLGAEDEPALTIPAMFREVARLYGKYRDSDKVLGFGIGEVGQFQLYINVYCRDRKRFGR